MKPNALLLQSYLDACYIVHLGGESTLQLLVGHATPALDALPSAQSHVWALINPGNARSAPWPEALNARRMDMLMRLLRQRGLQSSMTESYAEDGSWAERGVLIHDIALRQLDALAVRFGQHATLIGAADRPVQLRLYGREWRALDSRSGDRPD